MSSNPPQVVFVGEGALIVPCASACQDRGLAIAAIVSAEPSVVAWARQQEIRVAPFERLAATLEEVGCDVLFSVVNLEVLPASTLALASEMAVNFHDGPLPQYAGLNVTTWAIMAGETEHAVTWHTMTAGVDQGEILAEQSIAIAQGETAFSLNAKCFDAGIASFTTLLDAWRGGTLSPRPQGPGERGLYRKHHRPAAACVIDFQQSADLVARFVAALDFGAWANPKGWPRVVVGDAVLSPKSARIAPISGDSPTQAAGTVIAVDGTRVLVATNDGAVALDDWRAADGQPLDAAAIRDAGFATGVDVQLPSAMRERLSALDRRLAPFESDAVARRLRPAMPQLSLLRRGGSGADRVNVPLRLRARGWDAATRFAAYVARLGAGERFDLGFRPAVFSSEFAGTPAAWTTGGVARVAMPLDVPAKDAIACACAAFGEAERWGPLSRDAVARRSGSATALPVLDLEVFEGPLGSLGSESALAFVHDGDACWLSADTARVDGARLTEWAARFERFEAALDALLADGSRATLGSIGLLSSEEADQLARWNETAAAPEPHRTADDAIAAACREDEARVALVCLGETMTFGALEGAVNRLAHHLVGMGVTPGARVGIYLERSIDLVVAAVAIWRAGGAYVPLDPAYPADRIGWMARDAGVDVVLSHAALAPEFPVGGMLVVSLDTEGERLRRHPTTPPNIERRSDDLAYLIYTSGSSGTPKGVMVEHQNVLNFFCAMDQVVERGAEPRVWLAVTSLNFDISVLELFYTLARGFTVVIHVDEHDEVPIAGLQHPHRGMEFGLFYFSSDASEHHENKYRLLLEGARFGDANGFRSIWTPERHFHAFGGLYPNPAVTGAAVAAITERIDIRAGSCVTPLHHPVRVAEDWSVVDGLSNGRVGLSIAAGWQPNDFVLRPENYADRKAQMFRDIDTIQQLWRGESVRFKDGAGAEVDVRIMPRPVQPSLPYWVTIAGNPETFQMAGERGANVLTHLLGQSVDELQEKVRIYRDAWRDAGHRGRGTVTLMLHTMVGPDDDTIREQVRAPMKAYLQSAMSLVQAAAWSFPTFKKTTTMEDGSFSVDHLGEDEVDALLDYAFERYHETSGLFGSVETCVRFADTLKGCDVDELACLIDFGVPDDETLAHLPYLAEVLRRSNQHARVAEGEDYRMPAMVERWGVTHAQCVPSMAMLWLADPDRRASLAKLNQLFVGGEALGEATASALRDAVGGEVHNMYGPTETTVWSTTHALDDRTGPVPIGRPVANTEIFILDAAGQIAPPGELGELCIGGAGVVRGYWERDALTAERFIPHPTRDGARVYRTGDLARFEPSGELSFHGRLDHQVKLRGYRIELGEIEAVLRRRPDVQDAAVLLREDAPGDQRLVAYVASEVAPTLDALRSDLSAQLPRYMVPSVFVALPVLPTTPNGKIDRRALPAPQAQLAKVNTAYVAPEGELEQEIAAIWRASLQVERVGLDDNFFDLGGHSLLTIAVHSQLQSVLPKPISLVDLFRFPTIRALAAHVRDGDAAQVAAAAEASDRASARKQAMARRRGRR